jgi:lipoprotein-anchoring transpeptidase ErfK/SrfK
VQTLSVETLARARAPVAEPARASAEPEIDPAKYFGEGYPRAKVPAPGAAVGSLSWGTWIQPAPRGGALPLGSIRVGGSLPLLSSEKLPGHGKCSAFVQVKGGFVCAGRRATLDMESPWMKAGVWTEPAPGVMPYQYALSVGAPMLSKPLPPEKMVWKTGKRERPKMKGWDAGHDELAELEPIEPNGPIPDFLRDGGQVPTPWGEPEGVFFKKFSAGNMIAYTRAFEAFGEVWVLTTDMKVMPARGLKRFRVSRFRGVELGSGVELPLAWMRKAPRPKWKKGASGFEKSGESWPLRGWVALTGGEETQEKRRFLATREPGVYIEKSDATVVEAREKPPWEVKGTGKWIHVRVNRGTLTLYEGAKPVFTTLISPGKTNATPYGRYFVESKHHYSSMSTGSSDFWIADVPWTIYFKRPYAIHTAYWHEDFGERKSGGCINLSPLDARRTFDWVAPELPAGWDTVQAYGMGGGTFVLVEG